VRRTRQHDAVRGRPSVVRSEKMLALTGQMPPSHFRLLQQSRAALPARVSHFWSRKHQSKWGSNRARSSHYPHGGKRKHQR
jgi:hypothetical protein